MSGAAPHGVGGMGQMESDDNTFFNQSYTNNNTNANRQSNNMDGSQIGGNINNNFSQPMQQPPVQQNIFQLSSHPTALFFHLVFRTGAILVYLFCGLFTSAFVLSFVIIILLLAFDFWTVKNISGRLLVGLRWWNNIREDGTNEWIYESRPNRIVNNTDSRVFWGSLYCAPLIWFVFAFVAAISFKMSWLVVSLVALSMSMANVVGYTKCEKNAKAKLTSYIAGQSAVQGMIGNFLSNRVSNFFGGATTNTSNV